MSDFKLINTFEVTFEQSEPAAWLWLIVANDACSLQPSMGDIQWVIGGWKATIMNLSYWWMAILNRSYFSIKSFAHGPPGLIHKWCYCYVPSNEH